MYYRIISGKLFSGLNSETNVVLDLTQLRNLSNKIYLSAQNDNLGIPMINIDWKISESDIENINKIINDLKLSNATLSNNELFEIIFFDKININKSIYHPYGTTILGKDQIKNVVDHDLKVCGTRNLYCVSTSNFHNIGCANPTLTQLACIEKFLYNIDNDKC
jgi:choline dehydrogenase-like flavoprotein